VKNLLIALLILISSALLPIEIGSAFSMQTPKENDSQPTDYQISVDIQKKELLSAELEFEREDGNFYRNIYIELSQRIELAKSDTSKVPSMMFSGKRFDYKLAGIDLWQVDCRLSYFDWNIGVAQVWQKNTKTNLVIGKTYRKEWGIPYLVPINIDFRSDALSSDFKNWKSETRLSASLAVSSILDIFIRSKVLYYGDYNWILKVGLTLKLRGI
jgi:hypothetical protein